MLPISFRRRVVGQHLDRLPVLGRRFVQPSAGGQGQAEIVVGPGVLRHLGDCIPPDREVALVIGVAADGENPEDERARTPGAAADPHRPQGQHAATEQPPARQESADHHAVTTAASGRYMRFSAAICWNNGTTLELGAKIAKNQTPKKPSQGW